MGLTKVFEQFSRAPFDAVFNHGLFSYGHIHTEPDVEPQTISSHNPTTLDPCPGLRLRSITDRYRFNIGIDIIVGMLMESVGSIGSSSSKVGRISPWARDRYR